ncbi:MAG TPA: 50S ribosomal protein L11 methyltransferase [Clostridia bacterium]|nr:50S ribosomal protein L11 methyltransferase [Clostridia bacterium]
MKWQEIAVVALPETVEAVAECFYELGSGGVVIEDPALIKTKIEEGQWDAFELPEEILEQNFPVVKGYLPVNEELPGKLEELKNGLEAILARLGKKAPGGVKLAILDEEDWANSWKAFFKPLKLGSRIVIKPSWESYQAREGEQVIELDPGMAFGTGTHITTAMSAALLEKYLRMGDVVYDVGTGTGILAMMAATLGAHSVLALDYDQVAVEVARENIVQNGLEKIITVRQSDLLAGVEGKADLIIANIVADVILRLIPQAWVHLKEGGVFLTAGIIKERKAEVAAIAEANGLTLLEEQCQEEWVGQVWKFK